MGEMLEEEKFDIYMGDALKLRHPPTVYLAPGLTGLA